MESNGRIETIGYSIWYNWRGELPPEYWLSSVSFVEHRLMMEYFTLIRDEITRLPIKVRL